MPLVKLAWRNLWAHRSKTLVIGGLLLVAIFLMVVGNAFLDSAMVGLRKSFVESFTGEVIIGGKAEGTPSLFGVLSGTGIEASPLVPSPERIAAYLKAQPEVKAFTTQVTGADQLNVEGNEAGGPFVFLFGIDAASYRSLFDNVSLLHGNDLTPGQEGILLSQTQVDRMKKELGASVSVGDKILLQDFGNAIRQVTLRGIFQSKQSNQALELVAYVDPVTLRALSGISGGSSFVATDAASTSLLGATQPDELFQATSIVAASSKPTSSKKLAQLLGTRTTASEADANVWNFFIVTLNNPADAPRFIEQTNAWFASQGIPAVAEDWQKAAGPFAEVPLMIRMVFSLAVFLLTIVALIVIVNTLVASIGERTSEIGTMRALGAKKRFVWGLLFTETLLVCVIFGLAGMALASGFIGFLGAVGVPASNPLLQLLFGGATLHPAVPLSVLVSSFVLVVVVAIVAHVYPVALALRVQPIRAVQTRTE